MTPTEILTKARSLIEDPAHWTREAFARDAAGAQVDPRHEVAVCFCAIGALRNALGYRPSGDLYVEVNNLLYNAAYVQNQNLHGSVVSINDALGHPAVLALYDRAIALSTETKS